MSILTPDLGTGQSVFNGALPLLTSDNSSDNMVSGSYSHLPIEWSATEANQIKSLLLYMISIAQSGISLPVRNATGSILPAGPVQVTGIDVTYNKWKIALADANANSPAQLLITSAMLADTGAWVLSTAYTTSKSARPTVPNGFVYNCTSAGTSSTTEPIWPTTIGLTVVDGGVTWTCAADTVAFSSGVFTSSIDCSGSTVGNKVYLGASGIIQLAAPSAIDTIVQEIGRVKTIVNPGVISGRICAPIKMGTSWLQTDAALPSQTGNTGKVLQTNGTVSSWQTPAAGTVTSVTGTAPIVSSGSSTPAISLGPLINTGEVVNIIGNTGSSGVAMNFQSGNVVTATSTGNTTWSITNPKAAGTATTLSLILTNGGAYVQTWMSGINWGVTGAPTLQTSGINILRFTSVDGGSTWLGALAF